MSFFLDTQETTQRFGSHVTELRSLLDTNHIRHGSPNDLFEFVRTLDTSSQFRLDLSALVKSIMKRANDELLLTDMMSIIAASVGGQSVTETRADITGPTRTLMEFLLGTGCWRQFGAPSQPISSRAAPPIKQRVLAEEPTSVRISVPISTAGTGPEARTSLLDISNELRQTLSRLESNTEQVKHHLEFIEQRISKIEPPPEASPALASVGLEPLVHRDIGTSGSSNVGKSNVVDTPIPEPEPPNRGRAVFSHPPSLSESRPEEEEFSPPTFAYGTERGKGTIALWIFLVLVVIGTAIFFVVHSGQGLATPAAVSSSTSSATGSSLSSPAVESHPGVTESAVGATTPHSIASDGDSSKGASRDQAGPNRPTVRYVPANVMEGYLISAPRPQYPPQARMNHIEGQVALQATISRSGSIETLHVVKGPPSLRGAAIDAVRHWRYRPYTADGQAVKVATTVYVDFTLRPPPAMAH